MSDKPSFSERMRIEAHATWSAILDHRFFREVATDAIDDRVFARYLRIEYGFVDTAARALGYAVAKAPSFQERRRLGLGLYGLVTDQEQVFIEAFERMGASINERTGLAPQGQVVPLDALFLKVAETEGYEEILACTLAAEWMYLTWCSAANGSLFTLAAPLPSMSRGSARKSTQEDRRSPKPVRRDWERSSKRPCRRKLRSTTQLTWGDADIRSHQ